MKHVTVYTSPTCHFCHQAMDYLKEKNVEFEAKDISKDPEARKFLMSQKIMGVPAIYIDDELVMGFDKQKIDSLLGL